MQNPLIGHKLANFRVEQLIGRGGMAEVYYGHDLMLHRPVAIKVIDARLRENVTYAHRFVQEARTIAQWRHENIVQIFSAGEEDSLFYFVMEYIEGLDLSQLISEYRAEGTLIPHNDVIHIGKSIANALDFAHQNGVVHRDIKPSNVMIDETGRVALTDFGLALDVNQGSTGKAFGSAHYVAPEQARRSSEATPQSDLYSLGVILYEMLTGVVPFDDPSPTSVALQHLNMPPPSPRTLNPNLNQETESTLLTALSKSAEDRYPTGKLLVETLEKALFSPSTNQETTVPPATLTRNNTRPAQSNISVQEKVTQFIATNAINSDWDPDSASKQRLSPKNKNPLSRIAVAATAAGLFLIFIFIAFSLFNVLFDDNNVAGAGTTPDPALAQITPAGSPITPDNQSPTSISESAPTATEMPQPAIEITTISNNTPGPPSPTPAPTQTPLPNTPIPSNTPNPTPTILHPDGRLVQFLYDDYSFYILNLDDEEIEIASIEFEGLNADGQSAGYQFSGAIWASFYETLDSGRCNRIETTQAPFYLRPGQCEFYNSTVTPIITDELVFWSSLNDIVSFRVLWDGSEIGRCQADTGLCEVFLPR